MFKQLNVTVEKPERQGEFHVITDSDLDVSASDYSVWYYKMSDHRDVLEIST